MIIAILRDYLEKHRKHEKQPANIPLFQIGVSTPVKNFIGVYCVFCHEVFLFDEVKLNLPLIEGGEIQLE